MTAILAYELVSAGGLQGTPDERDLMPQGVAMRDAVVFDLLRLPGVTVTVADCGSVPVSDIAQGLPDGQVERLHGVQALPGQAPLDFLLEESPRHNLVWVIAPETGGLLRHAHEAVGPRRWVGSDADTLRITTSKQLTMECLATAGCRTPLDYTAPGMVNRWVIKPDDGAGALDTWVLNDLGEARERARQLSAAGGAVCLQPWVEGEAMSLSLMGSGGPEGGAELLSLNRQHLTMDEHGQIGFAGVQRVTCDSADPRWPALQALVNRVARALPGLRGFAGIDLVWHPAHGPVVIEVNARVTGAYIGLSGARGENLAARVLASHGWEVSDGRL